MTQYRYASFKTKEEIPLVLNGGELSKIEPRKDWWLAEYIHQFPKTQFTKKELEAIQTMLHCQGNKVITLNLKCKVHSMLQELK
jgi:hypothetical protein